MSREKTLVKNTLILTIGKVCTQLITFFLLPLYTGILSTEEYGTVDLLNTLVSLLAPIVTLYIEAAVFRHLIEVREDEKGKKEIISTTIFSVIIQFVVYTAIFLIIAPHIHNDYKIFLATNVIAYIFSSLFQQIARGLGENKQYSIASFLSALVTILANILFIVSIKLGARGMLLGTMLGQIACTVFLFIGLKIYKYLSFKDFKYEVLNRMWKYSIPLIPNSISWWIFNASDRVIVSVILGVAQNGILSAAHKFSSVYITIYNIFYMSWTEMIALHINDEDIKEFFNKMFNTVLKLFVAIAVGIIACMPFVYSIMINSNYQEGYFQVPIMMIGSIFNVVVGLLGAIFVAKKNTKSIANTAIISAVINIVINLLLIKFIGLYAATLSTLVAYFVMSIYRIRDVSKKYFKIEIDKKLIIKTIAILIIIIPIYYLNNAGLQVIALLLTVLYAINLNKDSIKWLLQSVREIRK